MDISSVFQVYSHQYRMHLRDSTLTLCNRVANCTLISDKSTATGIWTYSPTKQWSEAANRIKPPNIGNKVNKTRNIYGRFPQTSILTKTIGFPAMPGTIRQWVVDDINIPKQKWQRGDGYPVRYPSRLEKRSPLKRFLNWHINKNEVLTNKSVFSQSHQTPDRG